MERPFKVHLHVLLLYFCLVRSLCDCFGVDVKDRNFYFLCVVNANREFLQHVFGQFNQVLIVSVCLIELKRCEFWIVCLIDTLIPEDLADLEDSVKATNNQLFER